MPRLWIGKTRYTISAILAFRWRGEWTHVKVRLWIRNPR